MQMVQINYWDVAICLFLGSSDAMLRRIHGAYVSDKEIEDLVSYVRAERPVRYLDLHEIIAQSEETTLNDADDELLETSNCISR